MTDNYPAVLEDRFVDATPQEILRWAIDTYRPSVALSSSFGVESPALLHMATRIYPEIQVLFLDTGLLFPETHLFMEEIRERLKLNVRVFRASPQQAAAVRPRAGAGPGDTQRCCSTLKVSLMRRSLVGLDCWIAGLRRDQSAARRGVRVVETHQDGPIKVHPLAHWTTERVHAYMLANDLPFHPLWYKGYTSIGCEPCTRPPAEGGDLRSGRWMGLAKTECGIHTFLTSKEAARSAG